VDYDSNIWFIVYCKNRLKPVIYLLGFLLQVFCLLLSAKYHQLTGVQVTADNKK